MKIELDPSASEVWLRLKLPSWEAALALAQHLKHHTLPEGAVPLARLADVKVRRRQVGQGAGVALTARYTVRGSLDDAADEVERVARGWTPGDILEPSAGPE